MTFAPCLENFTVSVQNLIQGKSHVGVWIKIPVASEI